MSAQDERGAPFRTGPREVLDAFDADELAQPRDRAEPTDSHLDERHAERFEMAAKQVRAVGCRELRKARSEVDLDDLAPLAQQHAQRVAEAAAERKLHRKRQLRDELQRAEKDPRRPVAGRAKARERQIVAGARRHAARRKPASTSGYGAGRPLNRWWIHQYCSGANRM